jgi:alkylhydroperoxidase/carboxymuconolactone decarboxylase family protein YurZ
MDDHEEHLRRLAVHDDALLEMIVVKGSSFAPSVIDQRTEALVRVAATVAVDAALPSFQQAALPSFQQAVSRALAAGAMVDEIVATLEAVTPVTGARGSSSVPRNSRSATTSRPRSSRSTRNERPVRTDLRTAQPVPVTT